MPPYKNEANATLQELVDSLYGLQEKRARLNALFFWKMSLYLAQIELDLFEGKRLWAQSCTQWSIPQVTIVGINEQCAVRSR